MRNGRLISVIIPVCDCERYLSQAIESALVQTCPPGEVIVVDDGSTDGSAVVAERFKKAVRYIHQPHSGLAVARNRGIQQARGGFFAFLDADDVWLEHKLESQMQAFENDLALDMAFTHVRQFFSPEMEQELKNKYTFIEVMKGYSASTALIKRDSFFRVGMFDLACKMGEFIDWYSRAQEVSLRSVMLGEALVKRRIHGANMGIRCRDDRSDYVRIVKAALNRKRHAQG